jgi:hypothetical protein
MRSRVAYYSKRDNILRLGILDISFWKPCVPSFVYHITQRTET